MNNSLLLWRIAGGCLLGALILFFFTFPDKSIRTPYIHIYPWLKYAFVAVSCAVVIVFLAIQTKEQAAFKSAVKINFALIFRILFSIIGVSLLILAVSISIFDGLKLWWMVIIFGGYGIALLWMAISGKKPC